MFDGLLTEEKRINGVDSYFYNIGLIKRQKEKRSKSWFRYFVIIAPVIFSVKCLYSILIYYYKSDQIDQYKMLLISIHDFTYIMPKIRFHANMAFIISMFKITTLQIVHHFLLHSNDGQKFRWMKLFEMLSGKVEPSEMGISDYHDLMLFVKR